MLITKKVEVVLSMKQHEYYRNLGYDIPKDMDDRGRLRTKRGTKITVSVEDLSPGSHVRVDVQCDYCKAIKNIEYREYLKHHDELLGDCCHKCENVKCRKTLKEKYGVDKSSDIPGMKERIIKSNIKKFGVEWPQQNSQVYEKSLQTLMRRYGVSRPLQSREILSKMLCSLSANGNAPTSKPQLKIFDIIADMNIGLCDLEVPCGKCLLDIVLFVGDIKIDIEYDGAYWHQDKQRDRRRDFFVRNNGYKVLRIKGNKKDDLPSKEDIKSAIEYLLSGHNYKEIIM